MDQRTTFRQPTCAGTDLPPATISTSTSRRPPGTASLSFQRQGSGGGARALLAAAALALSLGAASAARAQSSVMLADGRTLEKVTVKPGMTANQVVLERSGEAPVTVTPEDLLVVDFGKVSGQPVPPSVRLINGDQVFGKVTFPAPKRVKIAAGWGSITVPLNACTAIRLDPKAPFPAPTTKDTLILPTDRLEGEIQGIAAGKVTINFGGKPIALPLERVSALSLANRPRGGDTASGLRLALDLGGGERLTGRWVQLTPDVLTLKMDWGESLDVPVGSISRLEVKNGKLVYLSDLKPTEAKQTPYLDGNYPLQADRTTSGKPLRLGGKTYNRGLGAHSRSEVTYALDGGYQTFAAMVGVDDAVGTGGSVIFRVFGDDKPLFESPVLHGGDTPMEIKVNLKGVLILRLEVDYADNGDAADQANWADARLLRP